MQRFALQSAARELLPTHGIRGCLRRHHGPAVEVWRDGRSSATCYGGLQTCASVWACPVCSCKISSRRREELAAGVSTWRDTGGAVALVTYTLRHRQGDDLRQLVDGLQAARRAVVSGKAAVRRRERFGIVGCVRALEVTHGRHGWHPHLHELAFTRGDPRAEEIAADLRIRWARAVERAGLREVNEHGIDVRFGDLSVAEYLAKFGHERTWSEADELAKASRKVGRRRGSRTPAALLADYFYQHDEAAGELYRHYAAAFHGRRHLAWSPGLRKRLGLGVEQGDEEIAASTQGFGDLLARLSLAAWRAVVGNDARAEVLEAARGGEESLRAFLGQLGAVPVDFGEDLAGGWDDRDEGAGGPTVGRDDQGRREHATVA